MAFVQHPGTPSRKSIQSVAVHLIGLYLMLEQGYPPERATQAIREAVGRAEGFVWPDPPMSPSALTVLDVVGAEDLANHTERVERWARSVWGVWSSHRETVRRWAGC